MNKNEREKKEKALKKEEKAIQLLLKDIGDQHKKFKPIKNHNDDGALIPVPRVDYWMLDRTN